MVEHEKCPRCKELGLITTIKPQRGTKELNVPGDTRTHECFRCGFKSTAVYKKGRNPQLNEHKLIGYQPDNSIKDLYIDRRWRWPNEEPFVDLEGKIKEHPIYSKPVEPTQHCPLSGYWYWEINKSKRR